MPPWSRLRQLIGGILGIQVRARNIEPIVRWLNTPIPELFSVGTREVAEKLLDLTRDEAPVRTGRLRDSLRLDWEGRMRFVIREGVDYGTYVRLGTRPHPIFPRVKRALWWPGLDRPVAYVNHPGTKPNPYHLRALNRLGADRIAEGALEEFRRRDP